MKNFFISKKLRNDIREYIEYCKDNGQDHEKALKDTIMVFGVPRKELIEEISLEIYGDVRDSKSSAARKIKNEKNDLDIQGFMLSCNRNGLSHSEAVERAQAYFGLSALYLIEMMAEVIYIKNSDLDDNFKKSVLSRAHDRKIEYSDVAEFVSYHRENGDDSEMTREDAMVYFGTSNIDMINEAIVKIFGK